MSEAFDLDALAASTVRRLPSSPTSPATGFGELVASMETVRASTVTPRRLDYLWRDRVPLGELTLWVGRGGLGKTVMLAAELTARATRGELDGDLDGPTSVLIASGEDAIDHTLVPRLYAAGADLERVEFVPDLLTLPDDVDKLRATVLEHGCRLVVVDPLSAHLDSAVDSHRDASIRRALSPLAGLAHDTGAAVVAVAHLNKARTGDLYAAVSGSAGLFNAARSVLLVAPDPDAEDGDDTSRVLLHGKSNTSKLAPARRFQVVGTTVTVGEVTIEVPRIEWGEEAPELTMASVLDQATAEERSEADDAEAWLVAALANGSRHASNLKADAKRDGIATRTLERAATRLKERGQLRRYRDGFQAPYTWELIAQPRPSSPNPTGGEYGELGGAA
ncbi:MAG: hypothetical protein EA387_04135 [Nitriliruptor sp.]|nr:MAG: hypothetical protein EA387_04135 [Nitriliruptor sp.]